MIFTEADWHALAALVFRPDYPHKPKDEIPNGDGIVDVGKRYRHVATKYLPWTDNSCPRRNALMGYLEEAWGQALSICDEMFSERPEGFYPKLQTGALRVLEYPAGASSALHTDFDLFTINLWRSVPNPGLPAGAVHMGELGELLGLGPATPHYVAPLDVVQRSLVYFAIPDHEAVLPGGETVGEWIAERIARSRVTI